MVFYHVVVTEPMATRTVDPEQPDSGMIRDAVRAVREGKVLLYPTDTIYGLGCDPFLPSALGRIFELKERPVEKGVLLLVGSPAEAVSLAGRLPSTFARLSARFWPGPVTFLLPAAPGVSELVVGERGLVGVRCPSHVFLNRLLDELARPLVSTSANISGEPQPPSIADLRRLFERKVDLFLDAGELPTRLPSSVVDLSVDPPRLVRRGALAAEIEQVLKDR